MEVSEDHECVICNQPIGDTPEVILGGKGSAGINKASKERNDSLHCTAGQHVHQACRKNYCAPNQIAKILKKICPARCTYLQLVSKSSGLQKANSILALTVYTVGNQLSWEGRGKGVMFLLSEQWKLETQFWECVKKGRMNGQMLNFTRS